MKKTPFDPNGASSPDSGIFGLPHSEREADLVFLPVPWEVTTSYGGGTSEGPQAILAASRQVDLFDPEILRPYEAGLFLLPESSEVRNWNEKGKALAQKVIEKGGQIEGDAELQIILNQVNFLGEQLNSYVYEETRRILKSGKLIGIVGGDHSVPFGALKAVAEIHPSFGILHFDAHSDTRRAFEGFEWSHASIMYNVLEKIPEVSKLIQVGIRDFCEEEANYVELQKERVLMYTDTNLCQSKFEGASWKMIAQEIVSKLPAKIWISFDIDGLDPKYCPHTGTPVPGGLDFQEALYLIACAVRAGKEVVGFDLNEVAPNLTDASDEWDANVGARLLYKLSSWTLASQKKVELK